MSDLNLYEAWTATSKAFPEVNTTELTEEEFREKLYGGDPPEGWKNTVKKLFGMLREQNPDYTGTNVQMWKVGDELPYDHLLMLYKDTYYEFATYSDYHTFHNAVHKANFATSQVVSRMGPGF